MGSWSKDSFNGGELSERLRMRHTQSIYGIGLDEMVGFAPLVEGPAEAMPGTIYVSPAKGPCRLFRFEYDATQGHVIEASDHAFRIYTNNARMEDAGVPIEVATPWDWPALQDVSTFGSYDVLYCFHGSFQTRQFIRDAATSFHMETLEFENGPFDDRNADKTLTVTASGVTDDVTLAATADIFVATDIGSLFQMEAPDFGDTPQWENGIDISAGALRVSNDRVYKAVSGGKTGSVQPNHSTGTEWDGSSGSTGVQWLYVHDHYGILKITGFTDARHVSATVLTNLPFSGSITIVDPTDPWAGGTSTTEETYTTWRWYFGSFSNTRGWPEGGCIWKERLCLRKGTTIYVGVAADLLNFASRDEYDEITADMALRRTIDDPNTIRALVAGEHLVIYNAKGVWELIPENAAAAFGPANAKLRWLNNGNCGSAQPIFMDNRTVHIDRSQRRIYEIDLDGSRGPQTPIDLTRYARQMGGPTFIDLVMQQHPSNHVWALRADGTLACAAYLDEEQVLGWANRTLADGVSATSIAFITDPDGHFDQIWLAVEWGGAWHVLRMAQWREDGDSGDNVVMVEMAALYEGDGATTISAPWLAGQTVHVVANAIRFYIREADSDGLITIPHMATTIIAGLPFPAYMNDLPVDPGGNGGSIQGKVARISRGWVKLLYARGIAFGAPDAMTDLTQLTDGDLSDEGWAAESGFRMAEAIGDFTREPRLRIERRAPFAATISAWGGMIEVNDK